MLETKIYPRRNLHSIVSREFVLLYKLCIKLSIQMTCGHRFLVLRLKVFFFVKAYEQKCSSFLPVSIEVIPLKSRRIMLWINTELGPEALSRASKIRYESSYLNTSKQASSFALWQADWLKNKTKKYFSKVICHFSFVLPPCRGKTKMLRKFSWDIKGDWERFTPKPIIQALRQSLLKC